MSRLTEILKNVGETVDQSPGLSKAMSEIGAEMKRLGVQGSAELASLLFQGHGYVPYGAGQDIGGAQKSHDSPQQQGMESPQHEHGGRRM
jgi:hypothetical protein